MNYLPLLLRGFGFWLGAFYAFTLGWSSLKLNALPDALAAPILLAPLIALIFGSLLPDKALLGTPGTRMVLFIALGLGIVGCIIVAADDLLFSQGPNMYGFWFNVAMAVALASLYLRITLARKPVAK